MVVVVSLLGKRTVGVGIGIGILTIADLPIGDSSL